MQDAEADFIHRLNTFCELDYKVLNHNYNSKKFDYQELRKKEKDLINAFIGPSDFLVLLDEKGKQFSSVDFANWMNQTVLFHGKKVKFLIGGAYGFHQELYDRSNFMLSISKMTFSHQMIRTLFLEQLYRSFAINNNLPYHH